MSVIITAVIGWFLIKRIFKSLEVQPDQTFEAYIRAHPDCGRNGQVRCVHCGGRQVWLKFCANSWTHRINSHVCKNCGQELYRSATRL